MPRIDNIGADEIAHLRRSPTYLRELNPVRMFDRLWPEPDWDVQAETDPWGAAIQHVFRIEARSCHVLWFPTNSETRSEKVRRWVKRTLATRRLAERLTGETALAWIMEGVSSLDSNLRYDDQLLNSRDQRWAGYKPNRIGLDALLYACVGHHRRVYVFVSSFGILNLQLHRVRRGRSPRLLSHHSDMGAVVAAALEQPERRQAVKRTSYRARMHRLYPLRVYRTDSGYGVGILVGPKPLRQRIVLKEFPSAKAANAALQDGPTVNQLYWHEFRYWWNSCRPRNERNEFSAACRWEDVRRGPKRREGDVSIEEYDAMFKPRGVSFGVSIPQWERQRMVNRLYDCSADLVDILQIDPGWLFLDRRVALVLGGQYGRPRSLAYYRHQFRCIVMHRNCGGAGHTLSHEWFHALDWHTANDLRQLPKSRDQVVLSKKVVKRLQEASGEGQPSYLERSQANDLRWIKGLASKDVLWSRETEMGARAFESLMRLYARKRNWRATPVAGLPSWGASRDAGAGHLYNYPTREELLQCGDEIMELVREAIKRVVTPSADRQVAERFTGYATNRPHRTTREAAAKEQTLRLDGSNGETDEDWRHDEEIATG